MSISGPRTRARISRPTRIERSLSGSKSSSVLFPDAEVRVRVSSGSSPRSKSRSSSCRVSSSGFERFAPTRLLQDRVDAARAPDVVGGGAVFDAFLMQVVDDPRILPGGVPLGFIASAGKIVKDQPRRRLQIGFLAKTCDVVLAEQRLVAVWVLQKLPI